MVTVMTNMTPMTTPAITPVWLDDPPGPPELPEVLLFVIPSGPAKKKKN
jgi:hypothetical protein